MAVLLDTGIVYAAYDRRDAWHERAVELVRRERGQLRIPAPVLPEVDHLLGRRLGRAARLAFLGGLAVGSYLVEELPRRLLSRVLEIEERFAELDPGFVDAAVVTLAEHLELPRIATTDRRDFEPMASALGLELLP